MFVSLNTKTMYWKQITVEHQKAIFCLIKLSAQNNSLLGIARVRLKMEIGLF